MRGSEKKMRCNKEGVCVNGRYLEKHVDNDSTAKEYDDYLIAYKTGENLKVCDIWFYQSYDERSCPKKRRTWKKQLEQADIPNRYHGFNRLTVTQEPKESWRALNQYMANLDEYISQGKGLLIFGNYGTGKTTAAVVIAQEALSLGYSVRFLGVDYLISELRAMNYEQAGAFRQELSAKDLLILDGLETDAESKWLLDELGAIISSRYDNNKVIIITTNSTPKQLQNSPLPQRYVERILHSCSVIPVVGKNWRKSE